MVNFDNIAFLVFYKYNSLVSAVFGEKGGAGKTIPKLQEKEPRLDENQQGRNSD